MNMFWMVIAIGALLCLLVTFINMAALNFTALMFICCGLFCIGIARWIRIDK